MKSNIPGLTPKQLGCSEFKTCMQNALFLLSFALGV